VKKSFEMYRVGVLLLSGLLLSACGGGGGSGGGGATADTTAPTLTLLGSQQLTLEAGSAFSDAGATASDNIDGDISGNIVVTGSVNSAVPGSYTLNYNVSDAAGNAAVSVTRIVTVVDRLTVGPVVLNDTGITWGGNYPAGNNGNCIGQTIGEQDCSHGRDALMAVGGLKKVGDGSAGFDFSKLDANGTVLAASATSWSCVRDNHTGLVWEVKTPAASGSIHDADKTYRWGGKTALLAGVFGIQYGDWDLLLDGSNSGNGLCGFNDWRVPSREQLRSIVDYSRFNPSIDTAYFPNTISGAYWSSSPYASNSIHAWGVGFYDGYDDNGIRYLSSRVRLVRGGQ